jgi:hypothetical protein
MLRSSSHGIDSLNRVFMILDLDQVPPTASLLYCAGFRFPQVYRKTLSHASICSQS